MRRYFALAFCFDKSMGKMTNHNYFAFCFNINLSLHEYFYVYYCFCRCVLCSYMYMLSKEELKKEELTFRDRFAAYNLAINIRFQI